MTGAHIYAHPARYEPFGLSVLEAAAAGCALVLGDIDSLRENWDGAALFVAPDDSGALGAAIQKLIAAPQERSRLAMRARARAAGFTIERMADAYLEAYRDALNARRKRAS
jgi:glycosyltransferase involved in cell wall biosynthesis